MKVRGLSYKAVPLYYGSCLMAVCWWIAIVEAVGFPVGILWLSWRLTGDKYVTKLRGTSAPFDQADGAPQGDDKKGGPCEESNP